MSLYLLSVTVLLAVTVLISLVGAKSSPWDWQGGGTGDYARFAAYEEELRAMATQPYFSRVSGNISVRLGETAYLPCRAKDLADSYMVTWMRVRDVSVLSVGALTFSSDTRYSVVHVPRPRIHASDWSLVISSTVSSDSGSYQCSVNTLPAISHTVWLSVRERVMQDSPYSALGSREDTRVPRAVITGPKVQYVSVGSTVGVECRISGLSSPPLSLYWKRGERVLTAKERPGISIESEKVPGVSTARLYISTISPQDSGNYSCISDLASPASVQLVVTQDHPGSPLVSYSASSPLLSTLPSILSYCAILLSLSL